jgi:predicted dehydrogenase
MPTQIGILGFAHGHVGTYCSIWKKRPDDVRLVAGWDHDAARGASAREQFGIELAGSPTALLSRGDVDAVVIGAETSRHAELCELAAQAGKAIVLQKPMALTLAEADRIVAAVKKHAVPFTIAWQMRVDEQNLKMKQLVDEKILGRIFTVRRRHALSTHLWPGFDNSWHVKPELNRGMWADDASHAIDFLLWLMGKPQTVMAEIDTLLNPKVPDDNGAALYRYADGTLGEISCSFTCLAGENTTEIIGENGVVIQNFGDAVSSGSPRIPDEAGLKWILKGQKEWTISDIASPPNQGVRIAALAAPLLQFLRGQRPPICTAEEGRTSLAMTLACYESAASGRRVEIDSSNH